MSLPSARLSTQVAQDSYCELVFALRCLLLSNVLSEHDYKIVSIVIPLACLYLLFTRLSACQPNSMDSIRTGVFAIHSHLELKRLSTISHFFDND